MKLSDDDDENQEAKTEIVYKIEESPALAREAKKTERNQEAQRDIEKLIKQLSLGNSNPGIGTTSLKGFKTNVREARGRNEGRVYYHEKAGRVEVLAKSSKANQKKVIEI